jgi:hypothetical protein
MVAAGVLTGPLGLGALLDLQGAIYLAVGLVAVRALAGAARRTRSEPVCVRPATMGRPK